ncbi:MAG TPA: hypothetical protein VGN88_05335, partial [Phycisphaerae bacterium]
MRWRRELLAAFLFLCAMLARISRADIQSDATALQAAGPSRSVASPAASQNADYLESQLRALPAAANAKIFRQSFLITIPLVDDCTIVPHDGELPSPALPVWPLPPMGGRPPVLGGAKPEDMDLIYGRGGTYEDLKGKAIAGRLIALDADAAESATGWEHCASLGAAGIVFLGSAETPVTAFLDKSTTLPLGIPRFYCDDPAGVGWCRGADQPRHVWAHLQTHWEEKRADNIICILPGRGGGGGAGDGDWINQWIAIQARYDAPSQVMNRAPGASCSVNSALLLDLAGQIARAPAHRGVVLIWTAGDEWNFRGTRAFLDLVDRSGAGRRDPSQIVPDLQKRLDGARARLTEAQATLEQTRQVAESGLAETIAPKAAGAINQELLRGAALIEENLQRARQGKGIDPALEELKSEKRENLLAQAFVAGRATVQERDEDMRRIRAAASIAVGRWSTEVTRLQSECEALENWPSIRAAISAPPPPSPSLPSPPVRDPLFFLSLAITGGSD